VEVYPNSHREPRGVLEASERAGNAWTFDNNLASYIFMIGIVSRFGQKKLDGRAGSQKLKGSRTKMFRKRFGRDPSIRQTQKVQSMDSNQGYNALDRSIIVTTVNIAPGNSDLRGIMKFYRRAERGEGCDIKALVYGVITVGFRVHTFVVSQIREHISCQSCTVSMKGRARV